MKFLKEREEVAYFMRRLYERRLTTCSGGNISVKVDENKILITASLSDKGRLNKKQVGIVTIDGQNMTKGLKLSMETNMHLNIYKIRKNIKAVIHSHPTVASGFACSDKKINCKLTGESYFILGTPIYAKYALMGSDKLADIVSNEALNTNVIIMKNHGIITLGNSLMESFNKMEIIEEAAKLTLITDLLNSKTELSDKNLKDIDSIII